MCHNLRTGETPGYTVDNYTKNIYHWNDHCIGAISMWHSIPNVDYCVSNGSSPTIN